MNDIIELITYTVTMDSLGQPIKTPTYRKVFADKLPIFSDEFFRAGQTRIKPRSRFDIHELEYLDEEFLRYDNKTYSIYRVFENKKTKKVELYCEVNMGGN